MSDFLPQTMPGKIGLGLGLLIITIIIIIIFLARLFVEMDKFEKEDIKSDTTLHKSIKDYHDQNDKTIKNIQEEHEKGGTFIGKALETHANYFKTLFGFKNGRLSNDGYLSEWSACSAPCGGGVQIRTYYPATNNGVEDKDKNILVQYCNAQACPPPPTPAPAPTPTPAPAPTPTPAPTPASAPSPTPSTSSFSNYNDWITSKLFHR